MKLSNRHEGTRPLPPRAAKFHFLHRVFVLLTPLRLREFLDRLLFRMAPDVPVSFAQLFSDVSITQAFWSAVLITFVFCFGGTLVGAFLSGTLTGANPGVRYFYQDWQNIVNYAILCPLYIGSSVSLIVIALRLRGLRVLETVTTQLSTETPRYGMLPLSGIAATVLAVASVGTVNFAAELLNPRIYPLVYWFMQPNSTNQMYVIGPLGIYYVIINFSLLATVVLAACFFLDFIVVGREIGRALHRADVASNVSFSDLRQRLELFTGAYLCSKAIVMLLIANVYTWAGMELRGSFNMSLLVLVLAIFGLICVPFPRYYVQLRWYEFNIRRAEAKQGDPPNYEDLRPDWVQGMAQALDYLIVLGFVGASWSWLLGPFQ